MFKLQGKVKVIQDTVQVTEKFSKREFVITDSSSMYPQDIMFQAVQDKCDMLDAVSEGDDIEVSFNLRGREWTSPQGEVKYFNTLDAWRVEGVSGNDEGMSKLEPAPASDIPEPTGEEDDDLPF